MHECRKCKTRFELSDIDLEWHKMGRLGKCPSCKRKMVFVQDATGYHKQPNGQLISQKRMTVTPGKTERNK